MVVKLLACLMLAQLAIGAPIPNFKMAGKGTHKERQYPMCYKKSRKIDYEVKDNNKFIGEGVDKEVKIKLSSDKKCSMPFDGKNVDMHEAVFFPTASAF